MDDKDVAALYADEDEFDEMSVVVDADGGPSGWFLVFILRYPQTSFPKVPLALFFTDSARNAPRGY